ncbi:hypothetical protein BDB00DRAFT_537369 [Zychaea mexicana]|uniref:uncharacterized protein n=1 Tax=Zychaea mexicana TaxID=64656 RepID=UPI0022FEF04C|nr:uncharacterized protein BDB00DRAFT_537369 [Zychaea mexicana]KAI9490560.1 hypothetical protein BDB00DRAFT_537369 [Zychaea mexicana]
MNNIITNRLANRLGPLSVLPVEILISIFALLSTSDRLKARAVCTAWNEWIMNTPLVWASTEVTRSNSKTICGVLPIVAGHIEKIVVLWDANSFLTPMAQGLFKNLKSFEMLGMNCKVIRALILLIHRLWLLTNRLYRYNLGYY